jgi:hypothetical protein
MADEPGGDEVDDLTGDEGEADEPPDADEPDAPGDPDEQ